MGGFTISDKLKAAFEKQKIDYFPIKVATAEEFYKAIEQAKKTNEHGAFVDQHSVEEYSKMRLYITLDGAAGIAITADNNIVSIFNGGEKKGVLKTLLPLAIDKGGRKLDNYDSSKLSGMYELYGFNPVSKVKFNSLFAPADWNYERDGEPDIVFWIHNGDSAEDVVLNFGRYQVPWDSVQEFDTYSEAGKFRDELIEKIDRMEEGA
ncbi:MAG: hypothetical protein NC302_04120 [Bacteroidales bacterium]|nr:hypothetical protein [Bacteroidales bacterium]MCM1414802.1 hypothetical protein [bacterium]MCM1422433.1 hypothetical protein [bacterium]